MLYINSLIWDEQRELISYYYFQNTVSSKSGIWESSFNIPLLLCLAVSNHRVFLLVILMDMWDVNKGKLTFFLFLIIIKYLAFRYNCYQALG